MKSRVVIPVALALLAAGCGTAEPPAAAPATTDPVTAPPTSEPPSPSSSPLPSKPVLAAADGTRLKVCADGTCEVIVKNGDKLPNASGVGPVDVQVKGGEVTLSKTSGDGFSSTLSGPQGTVQQLNKQVFMIIAVEGNRAVLRMMKA